MRFDEHLDGETSGQIRQALLQWRFLPLSRKILLSSPRCQAVVLGIAQHWSGRTDDQIHGRVFLFGTTTPRWTEDDLASPEMGALWREVAPKWNKPYQIGSWSPPIVVSLGPYCRTDTHFEMPLHRVFTPFAIARRPPHEVPVREMAVDVHLEVVGQVQQPGWEDAWSAFASRENSEQWERPGLPEDPEAWEAGLRAARLVRRFGEARGALDDLVAKAMATDEADVTLLDRHLGPALAEARALLANGGRS